MAPRRPSYLPERQRGMMEEKQRHGPPAADRPAPPPDAAMKEELPATLVESAGKRPSRPKLRIGTLTDDDVGAFQHDRPPPTRPRKKMRRPMALCWMDCCILFWLLVIAVDVAVLVVFLVYHPKAPQLRVISATLNEGRIDKLGGDARALNANVTVLAAISNPNTNISIVLRYVQLDLYFDDSVIGTQAVWPAPVQEAPRGSVLRRVHLVVSNVTMTPEAVFVWQNATAKGGGPVALQLAGRFYTQLNFGQWFMCRYWAKPQFTLWLDPPPSGALRRSHC
ncbi:hypothetical protein E2562_007519 [Oryza meyeriana var. granulata]|uniref:Late embryogenesis abundant protein LEA-2 subgroup domain-containing protein n=1 Tax=Oryza meyeriana var. granulata TaxID=110450 RepID=A0A6G1DUA3_9ORYZ|nr:hypothetical protein E2562_007519 [Oryza meyeriana var. granulata]